MVQICRDLEAQLARDLDQLEYEGVNVVDRSCIVVVGENPAVGSTLSRTFEQLGGSMRFLWVTPARQRIALPDALLTHGALHLTEHAELDQEIARKLNLRPSNLKAKLGTKA